MSHDATEYFASRAARKPGALAFAVRATMRLVVPVLALIGLLIWADGQTAASATFLDSLFPPDPNLMPGVWLTYGHLILALMFLVLNLTNRRYGASYAMAQVALVWLIIIALGYIQFVDRGQPLPTTPLPSARTSVAFMMAIVSAQVLNVSVFEWTRGRPWWRAPLYASVWGSAMFCLVFYPLAYYGLDVAWSNRMIVYFGLLAVLSIIQLVPYLLLRPIIRPLPGFGGA